MTIVEVEEYINSKLYDHFIDLCSCEFKRWPSWNGGGSYVEDINLKLEIFPNPANDYIYIKSMLDNISKEEKFILYSIYGEKFELQPDINFASDIRFDCSKIPNGIFFIKIKNSYYKIIILR